MRPRIDGPDPRLVALPHASLRPIESSRDARAVADLYIAMFRRDLHTFFPRSDLTLLSDYPSDLPCARPDFRLELEPGAAAARIDMFGKAYRLTPGNERRLSELDCRLIDAISAVLTLRYDLLFTVSHQTRLDLYRGGSDDHYVAAFVEPLAYARHSTHTSRIAATIQTLRTAALSTYENRRVSTGALLMGAGGDPFHADPTTPGDALSYGAELTALKSIHRLCDGRRTLFRVDRAGMLAEIVDIHRWAEAIAGSNSDSIPCARAYRPHARATSVCGHVCLVLSPNQEIKLFAEGRQAFAFTHGRWRILDPDRKFALWCEAVTHAPLARALYQASLEMAEERQGGLFVVVRDSHTATGTLVAPHDLLDGGMDEEAPPDDHAPREPDPLARRALHYLARNRNVTTLDPAVLEAMASLDGALVCDPAGRLLAFGAILRHQARADLPGRGAEGARTAAALVASLHGPVLKVSEDGIVSCFINGARVWDL